MRANLTIAAALVTTTLTACGEGPRGSGDYRLDQITFNSSLAIDPVSKEGAVKLEAVIVADEIPKDEPLLGGQALDELSGSDRFAVITDAGRFDVHNIGSGEYIGRVDFNMDVMTSSTAFYRSDRPRSTYDVSLNPSLIPKISVAPAVLNADVGETTITMSFEGLPTEYELPEGSAVYVYRSGGFCERDGETVINLKESRRVPENVNVDSIGGVDWPAFPVRILDAESLSQSVKAIKIVPGLSISFTAGTLDSCTLELRSAISVRTQTWEKSGETYPEILEFADKGSPPENDFSVIVVSQPVYVTVEKSVTVHWE